MVELLGASALPAPLATVQAPTVRLVCMFAVKKIALGVAGCRVALQRYGAFCNMDVLGGGWTLIAKIRSPMEISPVANGKSRPDKPPGDADWKYDSPIYANDLSFGEDVCVDDTTEKSCKSPAYAAVKGTQIMIQVR